MNRRMRGAETLTTLQVRDHDHGLEVALDRPDRRNAIDAAMRRDLHVVCEHLEEDPRPLLLGSSTPGMFASGTDLADLYDRSPQEALRGDALRLFDRLHALPLPTIALVDGPAFGGGAELAYACDLRIGTPAARFAQPETSFGILAGAGALHRLPRLAGDAVARDVLFTGRALTADEALRWGVISRVVPADLAWTEGRAVLDTLARQSSEALRLTKRVLAAGPDAHPDLDLTAQAYLFTLPDRRQRIDQALRRRDTTRPATPPRIGN